LCKEGTDTASWKKENGIHADMRMSVFILRQDFSSQMAHPVYNFLGSREIKKVYLDNINVYIIYLNMMYDRDSLNM